MKSMVEMEFIRKTDIWTLVDLPRECRVIWAIWVLKTKLKVDETVEHYKAWIVMKDHTQQEGVDFKEIFSPIIWMITICLILVVRVCIDLELHQMNVKIAFINSELEENIYMNQPKCFVEKGRHTHLVCKLSKSIYGLKQSTR